MTALRPFRALRYASAVKLADVLAPVYDVVAPGERTALWDRHPHSALRLELTRSVADEARTDYADVAQRIEAWRAAGVLAPDKTPALYVLRQSFTAPDGRARARLGFFAALRLEDYAARIVRPHERTLPGPRADRLKLLRATRANLSSVFMLYEDRACETEGVLEAALKSEACVRATDTAGVLNELAPLCDARAIATLQNFLAARPVVIADGHHRYETALAYRDERRASSRADEPATHLLAYFTNAHAEGTLLLPIHRLLHAARAPDEAALGRLRARGWRVRVAKLPARTPEEVAATLERALAPLAREHAFALDDGSSLQIFARAKAHAAQAGAEEVTVRVIHREVLEGVFGLDEERVRGGAVAFPKSTLQTARDVRAKKGALAVYLNALTPDEVFNVTALGETLPQKSTYFAPKLPTGLLFRAFSDDA